MKSLLQAAVLSIVMTQSFGDRVAQITQRITSAQAAHTVSSAQQALFQAELAAANTANQHNDARANAMLDDVERQLTPIDHVLTRANDGGALVVHQGDQVVVAFHDPYTYDIHLSKTGIIAIKPGIMWIRGVQGIYVAKTAGVVRMTMNPRPGVTPSPPPSLQNTLVFTIVVLPS